jgi:Fur family peroxide stress response transcriptional regulator
MITDKLESRSRNTRQRAALMRLLAGTKSHPTAAWLHEQLMEEFPSLSLGTVYRNLSFLAGRGLVRVIESGSGVDRFDGDVNAHYHLVCAHCGTVADSDIPPVEGLEARAASMSGWRISSHRLDFFGICPACRDRNTGP